MSKDGENYMIGIDELEDGTPVTKYGFYGTNPLNLRTGENLVDKIQRLETKIKVLMGAADRATGKMYDLQTLSSKVTALRRINKCANEAIKKCEEIDETKKI